MLMKALFEDSMAGYLIVATIVGAIVTVAGWAIYWKKKSDEERSS